MILFKNFFKNYIFGHGGAKRLAEEMKIDLLAEIPIVQSIRESADSGKPIVLQGATPIALEFIKLAENFVAAIEKRNVHLPPTKSVETNHKSGCSTN